ncbi:cell division protein FtsB [Effusibacillus lacus]|nr:cell division protein FtsB [Effusibacillus lacus]
MRKSRYSKTGQSNIVYVSPAQGRPASQAESGRKKKFRFRTLFLVGFSLWAIYTFVFVIMPNQSRLKNEQEQLSRQLTELQQQEQQLMTQYTNLQDDSYIARLARKYYNMIKQGEIIFKPGE